MNKILLLLIAILLGCSNFVIAADVPLSWDAVEGVTGYKVQMSVDMGASWSVEKDAGNQNTYIWVGVPDTGLVLFRAVAYNNFGESVQTKSGAWYCGDWELPNSPNGLGIK